MKILHTRKQLLAFFMPGFLFGILYVNFMMKQYVAEPGIFSDYFLKQYLSVKMVSAEYMGYLIRVRSIPFLFLLGLSFTKLRKAASVTFLLWTGFSGGMLFSMAVLDMGIKGSFLCIAGILPQFFFYVPAYLVVLWYGYTYPQNRWNTQKSLFIGIALTVGILLEAYVNPVLVQAFIGTL